MKKLFILVLNFNGAKHILDCLQSLQLIKVPVGWRVEPVVIDNASIDNSLQLIKSRFPKLKIIKNKENLGFAAGNNVGIKLALKQKAEAVLLLNQDTVVEKSFLPPLLANDADIVAPIIKFKRNDKWIYDFGGKVNWWIGRNYHVHLGGVMASLHSACHHPRCKNPDYVSGCCMLIKKSVFEKIGLLGEKFFLYFEDADFCLRAKKAGFKIAVEPESIVLHKLTGTGKRPFRQNLHLLKSNLLFINRHTPLFVKPFAYGYLIILLFKLFLHNVPSLRK